MVYICIHVSSRVIHFQTPRLVVVEVRFSSNTIWEVVQSSWHLRNSWNKSWIFLADDTGSWSAIASKNFFFTGGGQLGPRTLRENLIYWAFWAFLSTTPPPSGSSGAAGVAATTGATGVGATTGGIGVTAWLGAGGVGTGGKTTSTEVPPTTWSPGDGSMTISLESTAELGGVSKFKVGSPSWLSGRIGSTFSGLSVWVSASTACDSKFSFEEATDNWPGTRTAHGGKKKLPCHLGSQAWIWSLSPWGWPVSVLGQLAGALGQGQ